MNTMMRQLGTMANVVPDPCHPHHGGRGYGGWWWGKKNTHRAKPHLAAAAPGKSNPDRTNRNRKVTSRGNHQDQEIPLALHTTNTSGQNSDCQSRGLPSNLVIGSRAELIDVLRSRFARTPVTIMISAVVRWHDAFAPSGPEFDWLKHIRASLPPPRVGKETNKTAWSTLSSLCRRIAYVPGGDPHVELADAAGCLARERFEAAWPSFDWLLATAALEEGRQALAAAGVTGKLVGESSNGFEIRDGLKKYSRTGEVRANAELAVRIGNTIRALDHNLWSYHPRPKT